MSAHARRQQILTLLAETGDVQVDALAERLGASPNTIRNDLDVLGRAGLLRRVHGGAVPVERAAAPEFYATRLAAHQAEKQAIGVWAAGLVQDGDALVLDASSTVFSMATCLHDRRNLTVVTNGLNVALLLAQNPSNKVILAANRVRSGGYSVVGRLDPELLTHFYAAKCFISCTGFSLEQGLTEGVVDEALPKAQMMTLAREVIALVDHTKLGHISAYRFADASQIHHLVVDDGADEATLAALAQQTDLRVTVVSTAGKPGVRTLEPAAPPARRLRYRIGFGNMTEKMLFAQQVRHSLERAVRAHNEAIERSAGEGARGNGRREGPAESVELLLRDNDLDRATSLANVDWFIANQIDLMIEYQVDAHAGNVIMDRFNRAGIPVIAIDIPLPGAAFFGADNYRAGHMAGEALGRWIAARWQSAFDLLLRLEAHVVGGPSMARLQGLQEGLESVLGPLDPARVRALDCPVLVDEAASFMAGVLPTLPSEGRFAIVGINDEAVLGALAAFERAGRLHQVVAVGQNADRLGRAALRRRGFPFLGSTAFRPECYGEQVLALALKILRGEPAPPAVYTQHAFITPATLDEYYPESG